MINICMVYLDRAELLRLFQADFQNGYCVNKVNRFKAATDNFVDWWLQMSVRGNCLKSFNTQKSCEVTSVNCMFTAPVYHPGHSVMLCTKGQQRDKRGKHLTLVSPDFSQWDFCCSLGDSFAFGFFF